MRRWPRSGLRIGVHTGEVQLRDEGNYAGPTINRTARLRDLGHGGQTLLSGVTEALGGRPATCGRLVDRSGHPPVAGFAPPGADDTAVPSRPSANEFPPLRTVEEPLLQAVLPVQLTSFVGRDAQLTQLRQLLAQNRVVTLTGAGGVGKTRLAIQVAAQMGTEFGDGVWYVDLAPVTLPGVVVVAVARALGLPDQSGRSTMDTLLGFVRDRQAADGAGRLRTPARRERRADRRSLGCRAGADCARHES